VDLSGNLGAHRLPLRFRIDFSYDESLTAGNTILQLRSFAERTHCVHK
jgi:hypothetical protein